MTLQVKKMYKGKKCRLLGVNVLGTITKCHILPPRTFLGNKCSILLTLNLPAKCTTCEFITT